MEPRTVTGDRREVLSALVDDILARRPAGQPMRVAIDGRSAAGKSTTAGELADLLTDRGMTVIAISIDHFHRPGHKYRSMNREWTPETYFDQGFDYALFERLVLAPVTEGGTRIVQPRHWNSFLDEPFPVEQVEVPTDAILLVEGVFLARDEFRTAFDYRVWVSISIDTMIRRGRERDAAMVGSADEAERRYRQLTTPLHLLYEERCRPKELADAVLEHETPATPTLVFRGDWREW